MTHSQSRRSAHAPSSWTKPPAPKACWVTKAGAEEVQLLVFPEVFLPGFPYWFCYAPLIQADVNTRYQQESVTIDGPEIQLIADACREAIGIRRAPRGGTHLPHSAVLSPEDGVVGVHRKLQPTYAEYIWGGDGSTLIAPLTPAGRVSALCCWGTHEFGETWL